MPASDEEHVLPQSYVSSLSDIPGVVPDSLVIVPSCRECNNLAGRVTLQGIQEKRHYIQEKLKKRYRAVLEIPQWTEGELNELSLDLAQYVRHGFRLREIILSRLKWRGSSGHVNDVEKRSSQKGTLKNSVKRVAGVPSIMRKSMPRLNALKPKEHLRFYDLRGRVILSPKKITGIRAIRGTLSVVTSSAKYLPIGK